MSEKQKSETVDLDDEEMDGVQGGGIVTDPLSDRPPLEKGNDGDIIDILDEPH